MDDATLRPAGGLTPRQRVHRANLAVSQPVLIGIDAWAQYRRTSTRPRR
ncbi:hypothetical protein ACQPXB_21725 [Amycolatopsis sp. CA-161197]